MKQTIIQHKTNFADGGLVAGSGFYVLLSDSLPLIIGLLTAVLLSIRILLAIQDYRKSN